MLNITNKTNCCFQSVEFHRIVTRFHEIPLPREVKLYLMILFKWKGREGRIKEGEEEEREGGERGSRERGSEERRR